MANEIESSGDLPIHIREAQLPDDLKKRLAQMHAAFEARGMAIPYEMVRSLETAQREFEARGMTREAYGAVSQKQLDDALDRIEKLEEKRIASSEGWTTPILSGWIGVTTLMAIWQLARGHPNAFLIILPAIGTLIAGRSGFDRDHPPPRRRLIVGIVIGAALGSLLMLPGLL